MQYYRATVAYDGTDFLGFQLQASVRTVQGVLEAALLGLTGVETRVVASGRTDAGVHAAGQVVGFRTPWRHATADLHRALNAVLPPDVAVVDLAPAPEGWHPRFSALWRHYRYSIDNAPFRSPLTRRYALHVSRPLSLDRLQAAGQVFVGEHDFASFGRPMQEGESTVRAVLSAEWRQEGALLSRERALTFDVIGNAFLRGMVRSLVGSMLQVGFGEWSIEQLAAVLAAKNRSAATTGRSAMNGGAPARPAAACGLCLMHVEYDTSFTSLVSAAPTDLERDHGCEENQEYEQ